MSEIRETPRVAILGLGVSGRSAAALAASRGWNVNVYDERRVAPGSPAVINAVIQAPWSGGELEPADLVVTSPGIPPDSPLLDAAERLGVPVVGELEFGFRHCRTDVLAVTGTNGKTTTVELTVHLLRALGFDAAACGNIGSPLCDFAQSPSPPDILVAEVSSFQLERPRELFQFSFEPKAAACLNVSPDHLDRYPTLEAYAKTKFRLFANIQRLDDAVINTNLRRLWIELADGDARGPTWFGPAAAPSARLARDQTGDLLFRDENGATRTILNMAETRLIGAHNADNLLAALALVERRVGPETLLDPRLAEAARRFAPAPHRLERVGKFDGVVYVNDSKSTNPDATLAALRALGAGRKTFLILGGVDKRMDFAPLRGITPFVKSVRLIGEAADTIAETIRDVVECRRSDSLADAVRELRAEARPGDAVLLSPACASFDMFDDYRHRGETFKRLATRRA